MHCEGNLTNLRKVLCRFLCIYIWHIFSDWFHWTTRPQGIRKEMQVELESVSSACRYLPMERIRHRPCKLQNEYDGGHRTPRQQDFLEELAREPYGGFSGPKPCRALYCLMWKFDSASGFACHCLYCPNTNSFWVTRESYSEWVKSTVFFFFFPFREQNLHCWLKATFFILTQKFYHLLM